MDKRSMDQLRDNSTLHSKSAVESMENIAEEEEFETVIEVEIAINSIENIVTDNVLAVKIILEHEGAFLGESDIIKIDATPDNPTKLHLIDFSVDLPLGASYMRSISSIVSTPVLIKVLETSDSDVLNLDAEKKGNPQKNDKKNSKPEDKILGMCNVDILPIILGEASCDEKLILEQPSLSWDGKAVPWANLPQISISIRYHESEPILKKDSYNILNITVENIYNLPETFTKLAEYKCGTVLHTDKAVEESRLVFEPGKWTDFRDVEKTKIWRTLQNLKSRAYFSKYKISQDYQIVRSAFKKEFDLKTAVRKNTPRIQWNAVQRMLLSPEEVESLRNRITKYKNWPFEISVSVPDSDSIDNVKNNEKSVIYQCYVDASQLLYPGRTRTRVVSQLYTRSLIDMEEKTGFNQSIFGTEAAVEPNNQKSIVDNSEIGSESMGSSSVPVFTENGKPVLILVEFELYRPFLPARVAEEFTDALQSLRSEPKPTGPIYSYTPDLAHEQFVTCIQHLVDVIAESYRDFFEECECAATCGSKSNTSGCGDIDNENNACPYFHVPDELQRFKQFLHETGKYISIRSTLRNRIVSLLDQKFPINSTAWYSAHNQNFVASSYAYLVEQMHMALNAKLDVRLANVDSSPKNYKDLWFRAEEAYEFENYERSEKLITEIVCDDPKNADSWVKYAVYLMKESKIAEAMECCRQAIKLRSRHKIALLMYGLILAMKEEYVEAEVFLKAVTHLYPRYAESWCILHLFYVKTQYYPGIDLAYDIAEKCLRDRFREQYEFDLLFDEPMSWSTALCRSNRIFLVTTVLCLKLNHYEFAGLALSQELCQRGKSVEALYFLSVCSYLQRNYENAILHLSEAERIIGVEYSVAALMGHSLYKTGKFDEAFEQYSAVDTLYDRPEKIHLVFLRMGFYLLEKEEYSKARKVFIRACKVSPTYKTWLGVGIADYQLENFEESEIALTEANLLDSDDPEVWAYLCLLSMSVHRYDEFAQCYRMTLKNNLRSDKLWRLITHTMDTLGYSSPIVTFENSTERCQCGTMD